MSPKTKEEIEAEFARHFMRQLSIAKAKEKSKSKKERDEIEELEEEEMPLKRSIMKKRDKEMLDKIKSMSIEKDFDEQPKKKEPISSFRLEPPAFRRVPMPLPRPKKMIQAQVPAPPKFESFIEPSKKPVPLINIDLGKLNDFVSDSSVSLIQCDGSNSNIKIAKQGQLSETDISLEEEEIRDIIQKFADRAGKPLTEPIFKAKVLNLSMTAVISSFAGSKFVISKS